LGHVDILTHAPSLHTLDTAIAAVPSQPGVVGEDLGVRGGVRLTADRRRRCLDNRIKVHTVVRMVDRSALLGQDYWVVMWSPAAAVTAEQIEAGLDEHLAWMLEQERAGHVLASGPLLEGPQVGPGCGLTVLRVGTAEQAQAIAASDPFVLTGLRTATVMRWRIMEGAFTLRVSLGTARYSFD
jgi:uncharacterized protein YciI